MKQSWKKIDSQDVALIKKIKMVNHIITKKQSLTTMYPQLHDLLVTELKDDYNQKLRLNPNCTSWRTFARGYDGDWMTLRSLKLPLKRLRSKAAEQPQEEPQEHTFFGKYSDFLVLKKGGNV